MPTLTNPNSSFQVPPTLAGTPAASTGASTPSLTGTPGATGATAPGLDSFMSSQYDPYAQTIMGQYSQAQSATAAGAASQAQNITDQGNYNLGYQSEMDQAQGTQALESQRGFAVNPGAIKILQDSSTKRIKDLTQQMNDALANNQTSLASSLASLSLQENTALTNARTTYLNQYFQGQQEQRAEQSFQTPEQQAVMTLSTNNPGAGILPTDSLAQAQAKVTSSPTYQLGLKTSQAGISLAGAQAGQASAGAVLATTQAQQQSIINKFMSGDTTQFASDVAGLKNGSSSDATLHAKYDNFPGGAGAAIIASIEAQAQAQGWSPQQSMLNTQSQSANAQSLGSGGYTALSAGGTNLLGSFLGQGFGSNPMSQTSPQSALSNLMNPSQGQTTSLNGVTYSWNGTSWVPQ